MANTEKFAFLKKYLGVLTVYLGVTSTLMADVLPGVSALSDSIVRASAIAFVNTTTSPGLEGYSVGLMAAIYLCVQQSVAYADNLLMSRPWTYRY